MVYREQKALAAVFVDYEPCPLQEAVCRPGMQVLAALPVVLKVLRDIEPKVPRI
jgi:hypothetical protein